MKKLNSFGVVALLGILMGAQLIMMTRGYRLTADDVFYHYFPMKGWEIAFNYVDQVAKLHGRFVYYIDLPFMMLGATFVETLTGRVFFSVLHIVCYLSLFLYASKLFKLNLTILATLILAAIHPIDYFHLPPTSFPTHFSLPFLLITVSRIGLLETFRRKIWRKKDLLYIGIGILGLAFGEKGFAYFIGLVCIETLVAFRSSEFFGYEKNERSVLLKQMAFVNTLSIAVFVIPYIIYRSLHISSYTGNSFDGAMRPLSVLRTAIGHIYGSTAFASYSRNSDLFFGVLKVPSLGWIVPSVIAFIAGVTILSNYFFHLSSKLNGFENNHKRTKNYYLIASGILISVISVLPVAITTKYQDWCGSLDACIYVDSRYALAGVVLCFAGLILVVVDALGKHTSTAVPLAFLFAVLSTLTLLCNYRLSKKMEAEVFAWERAKQLVCVSSGAAKEIRKFPSHFIDPDGKVSFHPGFDPDEYWRTYVGHLKSSETCELHDSRVASLLPEQTISTKYATNINGAGMVYLLAGWSNAESFGTWSSEKTASLLIRKLPSGNTVRFKAMPYVGGGPQKVTVRVDSKVAETFFLSTEGFLTIPLTDDGRNDSSFYLVQFDLPNAVSPKTVGQSSDFRTLGINLSSFEIIHTD